MSEPAFEIWGDNDSPVTIEYSLVVLEEIRHHVSQGLLKFSRGGIEIGGILYGRRDGRKIRIESIRIIDCDHAQGPSFTLSAEDRAKLEAQLESDSQDPHLDGLIRVGWFVSHTRGELAMTETDIELFSNYFRDPWQVTLIIRPGRANAMRAAFFVWEQDGTVRANQSYKEFNFPDRLAGVIDTPSRAERAESRAGFRSLPPLPAPPVRADRPRPQPQQPVFEGSQYYPTPPPERKVWPWIAGILALAVVLAVVAMRVLPADFRLPWQAVPAEPLNLAISELEGQLRITWSAASNSITLATGGTLYILDGAASERIPLTRLQLYEGQYLYMRKGGDVEVRMEVQREGAETRESTRFLGRPVVPEGPDPATEFAGEKAALEAQINRLGAEINRLKGENSTLQDRVQQLERARMLLESRLGITEKGATAK